MNRIIFVFLISGMAAAPALAESNMDNENLLRTRDVTPDFALHVSP
ncbi:hypothetical protein ACFMPD_09050 [Sedimentitalea sp. HM32M-2]